MQPQQIYDFSSDENSHKWRGLFVQALRKVTPRLLQQVTVSTLPFKTRIPILVIHLFGDMEVLVSSAFTDTNFRCMFATCQQ